MQYSLKTRQVCFFIIAFLPLTKFFALPSLLAQIAGEDMWICALINLLLDFFTVFAISHACKKTDCDFFTLLERTFGNVGSKIVLFLYFIYFTTKTIIPLNEQRDYVELTLYTLRPNIMYFLPFFILPFFLSMKKLRVLGRLADVLWFITLNGIITLFVLSISNADFGAILPIGANGLKVFSGAYFGLSRFGDCAYLVFFIGNFSFKKNDGAKILLSYVLGAVLVLAFMVIFYCVFTSIAFRQRFALTEISKYSTVINNLGRFDYIGIVMILFSNLFSLSLPFYFSSQVINKIFNIKKNFIAPIIAVGLQLLLQLFFSQFSFGIENFITNYMGVFFIIMANVLPIIICLICKKGEIKNHEKG